MQIKVCPKCGSENRADRNACSSCYAPLESVQLTEGKEQPQVMRVATPNSAPVRTPAVAPGAARSATKSKLASGVALAVLALVILAGAAYAGWWLFLRPRTPEEVARKYQAANRVGDFDAIRECLSRERAICYTAKDEAELRIMRMNCKRAAASGCRELGDFEVLNKCHYENGFAVVEITPTDPQHSAPCMQGFAKADLVLVNEDGKWKVDIKRTEVRMYNKKAGLRCVPH